MTEIRETALNVPGALGIEKCFARRTGLKYHVDLHLEVDPELTVRESHVIATRVRITIRMLCPGWRMCSFMWSLPPPIARRSNAQTFLTRRMENKEIAGLLHETADLMEVAGEDGFRIRSYRNAAAVIASYPERIADVVCNPERKVTDISGIGRAGSF